MLSFAVTATPVPTRARTASATARASRARFAIEPPQPSSRRFSFGLRNELTR